jgi:hypothetical protein
MRIPRRIRFLLQLSKNLEFFRGEQSDETGVSRRGRGRREEWDSSVCLADTSPEKTIFIMES